MLKCVALGVALMSLVLGGCGGEKKDDKAASAKEIKIGGIIDLSGPTSSVGVPYAEGVKAGAAYLNGKGGVAGMKINLDVQDDAYNVQQGLSIYKKFAQDKVAAIQGFGTNVTEALMRTTAKDEIPFFSASYSAHLTDPKSAPYNFFTSADYSTQMRAALKYFKDNWKESRKPRLALLYPDHPYGLSPIQAGKDYAAELGFDLVGTANVDLKAIDATTQLLPLKDKKPDFIWCGGTTPSTSVILKDAKKIGLKATFFTNIWGTDENLIKMAGDASEGVVSLQTAAVYGQDVPGMKIILEASKNQPQMTHYIRGFVSMLVMGEGIRLAAAKGPVTGPSIKAALETMKDFDLQGLAPSVSYLPSDHRPSMAVFLYKVGGGKLTFLAQETLERKAEWLGK
ncbi:MAG: ABC transporter substrate-binding protein [Proteobacteria bacterium]|nr:ABC transporter substrate-binding protein [Pseudomonadota bacterium]